MVKYQLSERVNDRMLQYIHNSGIQTGRWNILKVYTEKKQHTTCNYEQFMYSIIQVVSLNTPYYIF